MRTCKSISTVSFNTESFLESICDKLVADGIFVFYTYIKHLPEEDERKPHIHLFLVPSGVCNTERLRDSFIEPTCDGEPLGCLPFRTSSFVDWYLYSLHDKEYLTLKCQSRKYQYSDVDLVYSDYDYFIQIKHSSDFSKYRRLTQFREMALSRVPFSYLVANGHVPYQQIFQYREVYNYIVSDDTFTGEVPYDKAKTNRGASSPHGDYAFTTGLFDIDNFDN